MICFGIIIFVRRKNLFKKTTLLKILQCLGILLVSLGAYFFFGLQPVPETLYEMQSMKPEMKEGYYVEQWCSPSFGRREFVLADKTRVDCLSADYAIEFDFAKKWAESIGQSLYYAKMTGKTPAVALILTSSDDMKYVKRVERIDQGIKIFLIKAY